MNRRTLAILLTLSALAAVFSGQAGADAPRTLVVGQDAETIQGTVDLARPGDTVFIPGGMYQESVLVTTPGITLTGEARTAVILEGATELGTGISVVADDVTVQSLTVQNYRDNGVAFSRVDGFTMLDLHAKDNGKYGLYAIHSHRGEIAYSYAEGHGDGGLYIGETTNCDCDVHHNKAWNNMLGYSGTANSYVRIWENEFFQNRAGILMSVLPQEMGYDVEAQEVYGTQVRSSIYRNYIHDNNNKDVPEVGIWKTVHVPAGEGITIAGGWMNEVYENVLENNHLWGVGLFWLSTPPRGNAIHDNVITGARYGIWWDEMGEDNCFEDNAASNVQTYSDPADLPDCAGAAGDLPCPPEAYNWAACRASDARAPSAYKLANLAWRSLNDQDPQEDLEDDLL